MAEIGGNRWRIRENGDEGVLGWWKIKEIWERLREIEVEDDGGRERG